MEDGDSVRNLNNDRCIDSHQHYFVHGTWSHLYVKEKPGKQILSGFHYTLLCKKRFLMLLFTTLPKYFYIFAKAIGISL